MSARLLGAVAAVVFIVALVALVPLSAAMHWTGAASAGLTASGAEGAVWGGTLRGASFRGLALGDVDARIAPMSGGLRLAANGHVRGKGVVSAVRDGVRLNDLELAAPVGVLARLPFEGDLVLDSVDIAFENGRCVTAHGPVRLEALRLVGGAPLQDLRLAGEAMCRDGRLVLPLAGESRGVAITSAISLGQGRYLVETTVRTTDPAVSAALGVAGFSRGLEGFSQRDEGALKP